METKNNGMSKDWNTNKYSVIRWINRMVHYYKNEKYSKKAAEFPTHLLNANNKNAIYGLSKEISICINKNSDKVYAYLIDMFSYFKQKCKDKKAEIPKKVFQSCRYGSGKEYSKILTMLLNMNVIEIAYNYCTLTNQCRGYRIKEKWFHLIKE